MKLILDACCGSRMFWFDKENPNVLFADNRCLETNLCDGRALVIRPDEIIDFRNMPYKDNSFKMVVFDPPHLINAGEKSWLRQKYGILPKEWRSYIRQGINECMRVLEPYGVLVFKWNEEQIKTSEILANIDFKPLLGDKRSKTHWMIFMKLAEKEAIEMAIEALEKQIPKKPYFEGDGFWDGKLVYDTWICPCCEKDYEVDYDDYDYCPNCGQAIDWSKEE